MGRLHHQVIPHYKGILRGESWYAFKLLCHTQVCHSHTTPETISQASLCQVSYAVCFFLFILKRKLPTNAKELCWRFHWTLRCSSQQPSKPTPAATPCHFSTKPSATSVWRCAAMSPNIPPKKTPKAEPYQPRCKILRSCQDHSLYVPCICTHNACYP